MDKAKGTPQATKELFDQDAELEQKITTLAEMIKKSKHFVVFTGAGISTSSGVRDFKSTANTMNPVGVGMWEKGEIKDENRPKVVNSWEKAVPSIAHMALVALEQKGYLKFLVSQNVDGIHLRSGFSASKLAELHGNLNLEVCKQPTCKRQFLRDFSVRTAKQAHEHQTGRKCTCGQPLYDSIINFNENLPAEALTNGFNHCAQADLCVVIGSSLTIRPGADMPVETLKHGGKLVIMNLQETSLDKNAIRINGMIDNAMILLMEKLELDIPQFVVKRRLSIVRYEEIRNGKKASMLLLRGLNAEGAPVSCFKSIAAGFPEEKEAFLLKEEPFKIFPSKVDLNSGNGVLQLKLFFPGVYGETDLPIEIPLCLISPHKEMVYTLEYSPTTATWITVGLEG
jgi:NAD-dependent SIR2 family protein deacetylase